MSVISSKDSTPSIDASSQKASETIATKQGLRRGRKRIHPMTTPEHDVKRAAIDPKCNKEKEDKSQKELKDQIQLQELYYATMEGDKNLILKESRASLYFKVYSKLLCCLIINMFHYI